jgi:hypothetical protein
MPADGGARAAVDVPQQQSWISKRETIAFILVAEYFLLIGWLYRDFYMDDAYIGFRYVANLLAGHGLVFNPPMAIEGVTNLGWLLLIAPASLVLPVPLAAKVMGLALMGLTVLLVLAAARDMVRQAGPDTRLTWLPVAIIVSLATNDAFVVFSLLGMETAALSAVFATMLLLSARTLGAGVLLFLGVLAFLIRPEAVLVYPLFLALTVTGRMESIRMILPRLAIFALGVAAITGARWVYFGDLVPNTFASKSKGLWPIIANLVGWVDGSAVNIAFPFAGLLAILVLLIGAAALLRKPTPAGAMALSITAAGLLFAIYALPDWTKLGRYFAPYAPVALIVLWFGIAAVLRSAFALRREGLVFGAIAAAIAVTGVSHTVAHTMDAARQKMPGYVLTSDTLIAPSVWMRDNLPAGSTIATRRIGALGFYTSFTVFDYTFGLTERDIARLARAEQRHFADPNDRALAAAWGARKPDYLLEDNDVIDAIVAAAQGRRERFLIHGDAYRVIKTFPIARNVEWTLAQRID